MLSHVPTGYGRPALDALRTAVSTAKHADPMAPVLIVAPHHIAGTVARRHLAREGLHQGGRGIAGVDITVLSRLAERIAAPLLAPRRPATRQILTAAWRRALQRDPGVFAETADHPATIRALVQAHRELRDLTGTELQAVAGSGQVAAHLIALHRSVQEHLSPAWYDVTDLLHTATAHAAEHAPRAHIIVYLPQDLSTAEAAFVRTLSQVRDVVAVSGHTRVARADEGVRRHWPGVPAPDLAPPTADTVLNASDCDDEVRCVVREVVSALAETPAHRVAILYTAADPYAPLLHDHLRAAGIRINGPGSRPIIDRALPRALLGLLQMADDDVPRLGLFRALSSAPVRDFAGQRIPVARWERVSRAAGVVRGADWEHRLEAYIDLQQRTSRSAAERGQADRERIAGSQVQTARALQRFVARLRAELHQAAHLDTWADLAAWCARLLATVVGRPEELGRLPLQEQYAAATLTTLLSGLEVLDQVDQGASLAALREMLETELAEATDRLGRFGDGVLVAPLSQAIGLDADVVHVVGLSEDLYPGRARGDALLSDVVRTAVDSLRTVRQQHGIAYRHLLAAFAAAPRAHASFPRGDLRSSSHRLPSRWLLGTFRELAGDTSLAASDWDTRGDIGGALVTSRSFSAALLSTPAPASAQEWRTRAAVAGQLRDPVVEAATVMNTARAGSDFTRFDGNLTGVAGLPDYRDGRRAISPTALETYGSCPHGYFVGTLLGVKPLEQPEDVITISPMDIGNLVHHTIDQLVLEFAEDLPGYGRPWSPAQHARLIEIAREQAAAMEQAGLTGHPRLWQRERMAIEADLAAMLSADDRWRAEHDARVAASEMAFGLDGHPPVMLEVAGGRVALRGAADKVDICRDGTVIVTDVKTGSDRKFRPITQADPLARASTLQLPAYALAARDRFGDPATPVRAQYWFVRRDLGRIGIDLTEEVIDAFTVTVGQLAGFISRGLFPPRPPEEPDFAWVQCHYCNPDGIGHGNARDRWERQRHDPALADYLALVEPQVLQEEAA